jgi:hypothetical protein
MDKLALGEEHDRVLVLAVVLRYPFELLVREDAQFCEDDVARDSRSANLCGRATQVSMSRSSISEPPDFTSPSIMAGLRASMAALREKPRATEAPRGTLPACVVKMWSRRMREPHPGQRTYAASASGSDKRQIRHSGHLI